MDAECTPSIGNGRGPRTRNLGGVARPRPCGTTQWQQEMEVLKSALPQKGKKKYMSQKAIALLLLDLEWKIFNTFFRQVLAFCAENVSWDGQLDSKEQQHCLAGH